MTRKRLSWDEEKTKEIMKKADPYTMNQDRKNPPVEKYRTGDPSAWAEDPDMKTPWKNEGRTETGHPAPARQAVVQARKLEDKALKCITVAQRMLPGADDSMVEDQATDLMFLPEKAVMATLQRQADLAEKLGKCKSSEEDEEKEDEKKTADDEKKADDDKTAKKDEEKAEENEEEVESSKKKAQDDKEKAPEKKDEEEVESSKKKAQDDEEKAPEKKDEEEVESSKKKAQDDEEEEKKDDEKESSKKADEKSKEASNDDLLDIIFNSSENLASKVEPKTGAKKLSGLVKKAASEGDGALANLWDAPPDVSSIFNSK